MISREADAVNPSSGASSAPAIGHDTTALNRAHQDFTGREDVWVFGYGSLIYKVDFPYLERRTASLHGWARRFWQGSQDHRGTPQHPGRVLTLIPVEHAVCAGMAYRVAPAVFGPLDFREKNGYLRMLMDLDFGGGQSARGVVYIAPAGNAAWLGPASTHEIARHIAGSMGPSGRNSDYVFKLAEALRALGIADPHVFAVEAELRRLMKPG